MTLSKHQHTVPKFYLDGFTNEEDKLWVYDMEEKVPRVQTPKNTGVHTKFYTVTDSTGKQIDDFESMLSYIESKTKPIIVKLTRRERLTDEESAIFSYFLALMLVRVPIWRKKVESTFISMTKGVMEKMYGSLELTVETMRKYTPDDRSEPSIDASRLHEFYKKGEWEIKMSKNFTLGMTAEIMRSLAQPFYNLDWRVLHAAESGAFITSDNPMSILSPNDFDPSGRPVGGILEPKVYKLFPLNKSTCLHLGYRQNRTVLHETIARKQMRFINSAVIWNCERFIISHDHNLLKHLIKRTQILDFREKLRMRPGASPPAVGL